MICRCDSQCPLVETVQLAGGGKMHTVAFEWIHFGGSPMPNLRILVESRIAATIFTSSLFSLTFEVDRSRWKNFCETPPSSRLDEKTRTIKLSALCPVFWFTRGQWYMRSVPRDIYDIWRSSFSKLRPQAGRLAGSNCEMSLESCCCGNLTLVLFSYNDRNCP